MTTLADAVPPPAAAAAPTVVARLLRHPTDWLAAMLV
jgi:hypothetical protein